MLDNGEKVLIVEHAGADVRIAFDALLCAVGRVANTKGYGLEELGIAVTGSARSRPTSTCETIYPNIYACGDVAGPFQFTHTASHQAWYAAVNALFGKLKQFKADYSVIPWATFIDPEVARVGLNETEAKEKGIAYEVTSYGIDDLDRAIADGGSARPGEGADRAGQGPDPRRHHRRRARGRPARRVRAAMKHGLGLNKILGTIHTYPDAGRGQQVRRRRLEARARLAQDIGVAGPVSCLDAGLVKCI